MENWIWVACIYAVVFAIGLPLTVNILEFFVGKFNIGYWAYYVGFIVYLGVFLTGAIWFSINLANRIVVHKNWLEFGSLVCLILLLILLLIVSIIIKTPKE